MLHRLFCLTFLFPALAVTAADNGPKAAAAVAPD